MINKENTQGWYEMSYYLNSGMSTAQRLRVERHGNPSKSIMIYSQDFYEDDYSEDSYA